MARTTINTQVIPDGTIVSADLSYPLTDFSSTGIDDNATSTALTIDSSQNVGIGATSPSSKAHIKGDLRIEDATDTTSRDHIISIDTTGALTFDDSVSGERMRVDWNGNVGIGISAPTEKLTVRGDVTLTPDSTSAADRLAALTIGKRDSGTVDYMGQIDFVGSGTNGFATDIVFSSKTGDFYNSTTNEHMRIDSSGSVKIGNSSAGGTMLGISDGAFDGTNYGSVQVVKPLDHDNVWHYSMVQAGNQIGGMGFYDNLASTMVVGIGAGPTLASASQHVYQPSILQSYVGGTERMRIDSSGNLGIGTTDPDARLDVKASTATVEVAARFRKGSTADTGGHTMLIGLGTEDAAWSKSAIGHQRNAPYDVGDLIFCLNSDAASGSDVSTSHERMRITSAGNVGIGTTAPTYKFVVSNNGEEGLEIDPINDPSTIRSFYYDRSTSSYIINKSFADQHVWTAGGSSEAMRLNGSGNLGIGTTTPIAKQHNLITSSGTALLLNNSAGGSGQYVDLDFNTYNVAVSGYANAAATIRVIDDGAFSGNITFRTKGASVGASQTERMRINSSGDVGMLNNVTIGTNTLVHGDSNYKTLEVDGSFGGKINLRNAAQTVNYEWKAQGATGYFGSQTAHPMAFITNGTERARIDTSGNFLVGTTTSSGSGDNGWAFFADGGAYSRRNGTASGPHFRFFNNADVSTTQVGNITSSGSSTSYNTTSDYRLKENIVDAPAGNIDAIRVRSFDWKADGSHQTYGMVAQELVNVAPEAVSQGETDDDMWSVDYSKLVPMMIKEIQDLKAEVAALKGE